MRQHRWLELIKDYDLEVHYHRGKANIVADALSRKSYANKVQVAPMSSELCAEFEQLNLGFATNAVELVIEPTLEQEIHKGQLQDAKLKEIAENIVIDKALGFRMDDNGTLWFGKDYVYLKLRLYEMQFFMRHMSPLTLFTLEVQRCT